MDLRRENDAVEAREKEVDETEETEDEETDEDEEDEEEAEEGDGEAEAEAEAEADPDADEDDEDAPKKKKAKAKAKPKPKKEKAPPKKRVSKTKEERFRAVWKVFDNGGKVAGVFPYSQRKEAEELLAAKIEEKKTTFYILMVKEKIEAEAK